MRSWRRSLAWLAALCAAAGFAHAQQASEAAVKAAFLYRFTAYVEWPESAFPPDAPFAIGVRGADEVATELEKIVAGRSVNARRVVVKRLSEADPVTGLHLLFVGRGANARAAVRGAQYPGVLTVTDAPQGLESGSIINFVPIDERLGFEVSLDAAERNGLRVSARMLSVARRVVPRG